MKKFLLSLLPMRWYLVFATAMLGWLGYANYTGWRLFSSGNQQQWSASGPGGHK